MGKLADLVNAPLKLDACRSGKVSLAKPSKAAYLAVTESFPDHYVKHDDANYARGGKTECPLGVRRLENGNEVFFRAMYADELFSALDMQKVEISGMGCRATHTHRLILKTAT